MPIYEYKCNACGRDFEELVRSAAASRKVACPECGAREVERRHSVFAAHNAPVKSTSLPRGGCGGCAEAGGSCPYAG